MPVPNGNGDGDHQGECYQGSVVGDCPEHIESQKERTYDPKKGKKGDADHKLDGHYYISHGNCGKKEYRSRRAQSGSRAFARNEQCIDAAYKRVRNTKRVADNHAESSSKNHARHCRSPTRIRSKLVSKEIP